MAYAEARDDVRMSRIQSILYKHSGIKKLCSRWISHNLNEVKKPTTSLGATRSNLLWNIITVDGPFIYCYNPKTKKQSTVWVHQDEPKITKLAREGNASKPEVPKIFCFIDHFQNFAGSGGPPASTSHQFQNIEKKVKVRSIHGNLRCG
ncbi:hypothetical protein EVAR_55863_1 [Eumeta japonica]|uniref:Mariner Mos1 transposase n=1 Tax=Eumeta variegata TaxID=151549 RepID=A0A4C1Z796_EUMVA|nr:hypothetical protein EVAR_55863_1 [Eumeta japonica]